MSAKLISITPDAEKTMAYVARVSSPHQDNPEITKLLRYCLDNGHWSVFEHAFATIEIETSRAISAQIIRHRSFAFSEFSQRYSDELPPSQWVTARRQAAKNRQSSTDDMDIETKNWFLGAQFDVHRKGMDLYEAALIRGVAREQARLLLPLGIGTRLFMSGSIRSWVHYVQLRTQEDTQAEHRDIALACREVLAKELPVLAEALQWTTT